MTTTLQRPDTDTLADHEFDVPCTALIVPCPNSADWSVWLAHTQDGCAITAFICEHHREMVHQTWLAAIPYQPLVCPHCGERTSRNVDDNIRWLRVRAKAAS